MEFAKPGAALAAKTALEKRHHARSGAPAAPGPVISLRKPTITVAEKKEQERLAEEAAQKAAATAAEGAPAEGAAAGAAPSAGDAVAGDATPAAEGKAATAGTNGPATSDAPAEGAAAAPAADALTEPQPAAKAAAAPAAKPALAAQRAQSQVKLLQVEWAQPRSVPPLFSRILYVGNLKPVRLDGLPNLYLS